MTKRLPQWVVDRAVKAYGDQYQSLDDDLEACVSAALQELFAIIAERAGADWRIEGCEGSDGFTRDLEDLLDDVE